MYHTFKCLLNVDSLFGAGLKVWDAAFRLAKCHGSLRGYHSLVLFYVDLVTKDNLCLSGNNSWDCSRLTYKREILGISGAGLNQELISPAVQGIEALRVVDIVHENAAISPSVECYA